MKQNYLIYILMSGMIQLVDPNILFGETRKEIYFPAFNGMPIFSHVVSRSLTTDAEQRAKLVCRLSGFQDVDVIAIKTQFVLKKDIKVWFPESAFKKERLLEQLYEMDTLEASRDISEALVKNPRVSIHLDQITSKNRNQFTSYVVTEKVPDRCSVASACRNENLLSNDFRFTLKNSEHPFIHQCGKWLKKERDDISVFTQVTCLNAVEENEGLSLITKFGFKESDILDREICQSSSEIIELTKGSIRAPQVGDCNYNPWKRSKWDSSSNFKKPFFGESLFMYALLSGRIDFGIREGPQCVQNILKNYSELIIDKNYEISKPERIKQAFCVDRVKLKKNVNGECIIEIDGRDFFQKQFFQTIVRGEKNFISSTTDKVFIKEAGLNCEEWARQCWESPELSCDNAKFCPAPGIFE